MGYFNYHAQVKKLISSGHVIGATIFDRYHHIYPALVIYFDNHAPMPIREYLWKNYFNLLADYDIEIEDLRERK